MSSRRDRIRAKIMSRVRIDPVTGCWEWTGPDSGKTGRGKGYPRMSLDGQTVAVHIAMWTNEHGYIPGKKELDHACRNRLCVRPDKDHVEMVTRKENAKRREQAKRGMIGHNGGPIFECEEMEASS
ncbi:HNH endonuclease signature motif containing protein [Sinorhizobium meliloti]|uniref:HNH endonuclease signature motif containing protein n=1 Tax=Rhizobium meliloti TaxID=382 RepID=UPI000FD83AC8|nr:HNH endonuclease signature motif containing protein [Sinorhizobium meliloti]RVG28018.1 HNH endonuclease [Sinorhizobium meliloti]